MDYGREEKFWRLFQAEIWRVLALGKDKQQWDALKKKMASEGQYRVLKVMQAVEPQMADVGFGMRYFWLTSVVNGRKYPPLAPEMGGSARWNQRVLSEQYRAPLEIHSAHEAPCNDIVQNPAINDCSFVASLINIKNKVPASLRIMSPMPSLYNLNLHFNGASNRLVQVDLAELRNRPSVISNDPLDAIFENAYLQVKNDSSFNYCGSNTAVDTFLLNGFIPEICKSDKSTFSKICKLFRSSACLISIGTGASVTDPQFLINHDYPVMDLTEDNLLVIRDPLNSQKVWNLQERAFFENFQVAYLNWNPALLFAKHQVQHFKYDITKSNTSSSPIDKPVFEIQNNSDKPEPAWILLERHINTSAIESDKCYVDETSYDLLPGYSGNGSNMGFHLLKLNLQPQEHKLVVCHSDISANYSLHFHHVSNLIQVHKFDKCKVLVSVQDEWNATDDCGPFSNSCYYMNPTFELIVRSTEQTTHYVNIQLISSGCALVNAQVFYLDDRELARPILFDSRYEEKIHCRRAIPLATNTSYQIVCSSYKKDNNSTFQLTVINSSRPQALHLKRIYPQFGPYKYRERRDFKWSPNSNRKKFTLSSNFTTAFQLRILRLQFSPALSIRVNVFTTDTKQSVVENKCFSTAPRHGLVISDAFISSRQSLTLLIEKDGPSQMLDETLMRLEVGSEFQIAIDEL
ncbi:LANO_0G18052g1_1 [Lachancea nothofagi CBS 11611]|uniref:Cysteine protease RIM13 n=1 Tax=Lachancea nothofagi CBS 11611 TaxID=1266666 RepID=A0A1G4KKY9_9SACH|nr:LANO_0G18052g1_1 [Lachancea nothofagi CBS 11611]